MFLSKEKCKKCLLEIHFSYLHKKKKEKKGECIKTDKKFLRYAYVLETKVRHKNAKRKKSTEKGKNST